MGKRLLTTVTIFILAMTCALAQGYVAPPVTVSKDKVKLDGKTYYTHVVLEKQTLYSISKAYDVPIDDIFDANEAIGLRENGLKKNSIILIPVKQKPKKGRGENAVPETDQAGTADETQNSTEAQTKEKENANVQQDQEPQAESAVTEPADSVAVIEEESSELADSLDRARMAINPKNDVHLAIMLPLRLSGSKGAQNYMDFYSGALLAARERGLHGTNIDLSVFDTEKGIPDLSDEQYDWLDAIIGPVYSDEMEQLLAKVPEDFPVISPMDPRTEDLCLAHRNLIQVHHGSETQFSDLVEWVKTDFHPGDKVVLVCENDKNEIPDKIAGLLADAGIDYQTFSYGILQGRNALTTIRSKMSKGNITNRLILASENEAFTNDALKNASMAVSAGYDVALYAMSKAKTYDTTDPVTMHGSSLHLTAQYDVDYNDARVKDFILKYRGVFKTEPSSYSYQGYDLMWYFTGVISGYGDNWMQLFTGERSRLLQTDLQFERIAPEGGLINKALRHEVYKEDFGIEFLNQ